VTFLCFVIVVGNWLLTLRLLLAQSIVEPSSVDFGKSFYLEIHAFVVVDNCDSVAVDCTEPSCKT